MAPSSKLSFASTQCFSDNRVSVMKFVGYDYKKERTAAVDLEADLDEVDIEQD